MDRPPDAPPATLEGSNLVRDSLGRPLRDLRVSVTDRCNFRCRYCMPRERFGAEHQFLPRAELLRFEEVARVVRLLGPYGLTKVRFTGGEPLLRSHLPELVRQVKQAASVTTALTTNGVLLPRHAESLREAGLDRLAVSLDALDPEAFRRVTDSDYDVADVLGGIAAAEAAGFRQLKINCVIRRGHNEQELLPLARRFHGSGHVLRFIEYMDVGTTNGWRAAEVVSAQEMLERIDAELPIEPLPRAAPGDVATRYRYRDGGGELGIIASVTQPFCGDCTRLRLSADGQLYTCLFTAFGHDLRGPLRAGATDSELGQRLKSLWEARADRYSEQRALLPAPRRKIEMSYIGG